MQSYAIHAKPKKEQTFYNLHVHIFDDTFVNLALHMYPIHRRSSDALHFSTTLKTYRNRIW